MLGKIISGWVLALTLSTSVLAGEPAPFGPLPSERQLRWHEMEMYGLVHFGLNTFQDKEWGYGDASPGIFNPVKFDALQIVRGAKSAGLKGLILVAKHHDGFCLWPTATTSYNISASPWRGGKGDMVREFADACRQEGLKFGLYCSPWDRNSAAYGTDSYLQIYRAQWRELYSQYGDLFISWHDGANGGDGFYGGAREKRTIDRTVYYDWDNTWKITRQMQPGAVIFSDVGLDVRWVGNEKGFADETHWASFSPFAPDGKSKGAPGFANDFASPKGMRNGTNWLPAECDVPLRPGWFFHPDQDARVKTLAQLRDIYYKSVGRGANLDLGLAPNTLGLLHDNDLAALAAFGAWQREVFATDFAKGARVIASNVRKGGSYLPVNLLDGDRYSFWGTDDAVLMADATLTLKKPSRFNVIRLRENIKLGQRIDEYAIEIWQNGNWRNIAKGTSIGANRLVHLPAPVTASKVRIRIIKAAACPALSEVGIFFDKEG